MPATLIGSRANPRVKQLRAAFAGNARLSGGLVAIEGEILLNEAFRSGLVFKTIFLSERIDPPAWLPRNVELLTLPQDVFESAVDTQHPQGVAALLVPPVWTLDSAFPANRVPLLLIAAGLQDPGNLGTLIRSAEAFGATAVLTTPGTVSPWNQKALRASAGSVFRVPVVSVNASELATLASRGLRIFAAVAPESRSGPRSTAPGYSATDSRSSPNGRRTAPTLATAADLTQPCALMIGNEGAGLSADLLALADSRITIPTPGPVESLNAAVAGSLLLYEVSRQRLASDLPLTTLHLPLSQ